MATDDFLANSLLN